MAKRQQQLKSSKVTQAWEYMADPLRGLTATGIEMMMQNAKHGNDARLQYAFFEVERLTPIYNVCIAKRLAGVTNRQWDIVPIETSDKAKAQAEAVKKMFAKADTRNEDGLTAAIRHLVLASFRGRSAVKPFFVDGELVLKPLQNWNFLEYAGKLYWNPTAEPIGWFTEDSVPEGVVSLPKDEVCYVIDDKPIDMPGILIYLRQLVGEEQWARFIEKQGIPQVIITAPEGTPDSTFGLWNSRAQALFEGGSGVVPYGSRVDFATEARSQDPFTSFIQH